MSAITKPRTSFKTLFKSLFSSEVDIEMDTEELPKELDDVLKTLAIKGIAVEQPITGNVSNNSKKGGFGNKINPIENKRTEDAMRKKHNQVQKLIEDRERE